MDERSKVLIGAAQYRQALYDAVEADSFDQHTIFERMSQADKLLREAVHAYEEGSEAVASFTALSIALLMELRAMLRAATKSTTHDFRVLSGKPVDDVIARLDMLLALKGT